MSVVRQPIALAALGAGLIVSGLLGAVGLRAVSSPIPGTGGIPEYEGWFVDESDVREAVRLEAKDRAAVAAIKAKDQAARELIEGRLTFAESVARFRAADAGRQRHPEHLPVLRVGEPVEASYARQVVARAEALLEFLPASGGARDRLSADLRKFLDGMAESRRETEVPHAAGVLN
jgi:hypothetical protein